MEPFLRTMLVLILILSAMNGCRASRRNIQRNNSTSVSRVPSEILDDVQLRHLVRQDPLAFLAACRRHYRDSVRDYRCLFRKQERVEGTLQPEEHIKINFREKPYSVAMEWVRNARRAARLIYVEGRWTENGSALAHIQPAGVLGILAPLGVKRDIHGAELMKESRRPVDQFGFDQTLRLIIQVCRRASSHPQYGLQLVGETTFHGRRCYHLERRLPYNPGDHSFPNRLLDVFVDCEWYVPIGCIGFADDRRSEILSSYLMLEPEFNVGLTDSDF